MLGFLYLLLLIFIIVYEIIRKKKEKIDYLTICNIYFGVYYCVPPIISNFFDEYTSRYIIYIKDVNESFLGFFIVLVSYFCLILGFNKRIVYEKKEAESRIISRYIPNENNFFKLMVWVLLVVGILSFSGYAAMYGGISSLIYNSALIRNNDFQTISDYSSVEFISKFIVCLLMAAFIVYGLFLKKQSSKILVVFTTILALIYLIVHAGRAAFLTFFFVIVFSNISIKKKNVKPIQWITMIVLVILTLLYLRPFLESMSYMPQGREAVWSNFKQTIRVSSASNGIKDALFRVCTYFEHKSISNEIAIRSIANGSYKFNFFSDIISAAVAIIPSFLLPFEKPSSIVVDNTLLFKGNIEGGMIPPGGVAFGYYACGIVGVVIFSWIVGVIGRRMMKFFNSYDSKVITVLKIYGMFVWTDLFINGELRQWFLRYFVYLIIILVISRFSIIRKGKNGDECSKANN